MEFQKPNNIISGNLESKLLFDKILQKLKQLSVDALSLPANISTMGSSPKDLTSLANVEKKREILSILAAVELGDKLSLLSDVNSYQSEDVFIKREGPYISRFTLYSILEDIIEQAGKIREDDTMSYKEVVNKILVNNGLSVDTVGLLQDLIELNEEHYTKQFDNKDAFKLQIVKRVLRNYK